MKPRVFNMEQLEPRHLLSSVPFATGTIGSTLQDDIVLTMNSSKSVALDTKVVVEILVEADFGSALDPGRMDISGGAYTVLSQNTNFNGKSSFMLVELILNQQYTINVQAEGSVGGDYVVSVCLAGDLDGSGKIDPLEYAKVEAAVYQGIGFSATLAKQFQLAYGIDLYRDNYYNAKLDINGNGIIDPAELIKINGNYILSTNDIIITPDIITDNAAPEITNVAIKDGSGVSVDTPLGAMNTWNGPWLATQQTDLVTNATLNPTTGFFITGTLYDQSQIVSANGKFSYGGNDLTFNMLANNSYYTYNSATGAFSLDVIAALAAMGVPNNPVSEGTYTLSVWGTDEYGNSTTSATAQITTVIVDRTPPATAPDTITLPAAVTHGTTASGAVIISAGTNTVTVSFTGAATTDDYIQLWRKNPAQPDDAGTLIGYKKLTAQDITNGYVTFSNVSLSDGEYMLYSRMLDEAGNANATISYQRVLIDTANPVITANLTHNATPATRPLGALTGVTYTYDTTADFSITATDATDMTYWLYIDGVKSLTAVYNTGTGKFEGIDLAYGTHEFYVVIEDSAGHSSTSNTVRIRSNAKPEAVGTIPAHTQVDTGLIADRTWTFDLTGYFTDANIPDGDALTYSVTHTGAAVQSASVSGTTLTVVFNTIPAGQINLAGAVTVKATDKDGEYAESSFNVLYTKDNAPPTLIDVTISPNYDYLGTNDYLTRGNAGGTFIISGKVFDTTGIASIGAKLKAPDGTFYDVSGYLSTVSEASITPIDVKALVGASYEDGDYELYIWGADTLGNAITEAEAELAGPSYTFTLDATAPPAVTNISFDLFTKSRQPEITVTMALPSTTDDTNTETWIRFIIKNASNATVVDEVMTYAAYVAAGNKFVPPTQLADGVYTISAYTFDRAGNETTPYLPENELTPRKLTVDNIAPVISSVTTNATMTTTSTATFTSDTPITITAAAEDATRLTGSLVYTLYSGSGVTKTEIARTAGIDDPNYTFTQLSGGGDIELSYGDNVFTVIVEDAAGNRSEEFTITVIHNLPPAFGVGGIPDQTLSVSGGTRTGTVNLTDYFDDEDYSTVTYANVVCSDSSVFVSTPAIVNGVLTFTFKELAPEASSASSTITVTVTDYYGATDTATFTATYLNRNTAPHWVNQNRLEVNQNRTGTSDANFLSFDLHDLITDAETDFEDLIFEDIEIAFVDSVGAAHTYTVGGGITKTGDYTYTWTPPTGYYGQATLSVTVTDLGLAGVDPPDGDPITTVPPLEKPILVKWQNVTPSVFLEAGEDDELEVPQNVPSGTIDFTGIYGFDHAESTCVGTYPVEAGLPVPHSYADVTWCYSITSGAGLFVDDSVSITDGVLSYTLKTGVYGTVTFSVWVEDAAEAESNKETFTLTVSPVSYDPVGASDTLAFQITGDAEQSFNLLENDDPSSLNPWKSVFVYSVTINGETYTKDDVLHAETDVIINGETYSIEFWLNASGRLAVSFENSVDLMELLGGSLSFTYVLSDDGTLPSGITAWYGGSTALDPKTVSVTGNTILFTAVGIVLQDPINETVTEYQTLTIDLRDYIVNYDSGATYTFDVGTPTHGTLTPTATPGVYTYTPNPGSASFYGSASFTFTVEEEDESASGTVNITVENFPEKPTVGSGAYSYSVSGTEGVNYTVKLSDLEAAMIAAGYVFNRDDLTDGKGDMTFTFDLDGIKTVSTITAWNNLTVTYTPVDSDTITLTLTSEQLKYFNGKLAIPFTVKNSTYITAPDFSSGSVEITIIAVNNAPIFSFESADTGFTTGTDGNGTLKLTTDTVISITDIHDGPAGALDEYNDNTVVFTVAYAANDLFTIDESNLNTNLHQIVINPKPGNHVGSPPVVITITGTDKNGAGVSTIKTITVVMAMEFTITDGSLEISELAPTTYDLTDESSSTQRLDRPVVLDVDYTIPEDHILRLRTGSVLQKDQIIPAGVTVTGIPAANRVSDGNGGWILTKETILTADVRIPAGTKLLADTRLARDSDLFDGTYISLPIKNYTLNGEVYNLTGDTSGFVSATTLTKEFSLGSGPYTKPAGLDFSGTFIDDIDIRNDGGEYFLVVHYKTFWQVLADGASRDPVDLTLLLGTEEIEVPVTISFDDDYAGDTSFVNYYFRVVEVASGRINSVRQYSTEQFEQAVKSGSLTVEAGTTVYIEVWMQNTLPIYDPILANKMGLVFTANEMSIYGTCIGFNDDISYSFTPYPASGSGNAGGYYDFIGTPPADPTPIAWYNSDYPNLYFGYLGLGSDVPDSLLGKCVALSTASTGSAYYGSYLNNEYAKIMGGWELTLYSPGEITLNMSVSVSSFRYAESGMDLLDFVGASQIDTQPFTITFVAPSPLLGTESARETIVEGTGVYMTLSKDPNAPAVTAVLPENEAWITEWDTHYVNLWVNTQDPNVNLSEILFNLKYNTNYFTATGIEYTDAILGLTAEIVDADGMILNIGGTLASAVTRDDGFVLIGRVKMESLGSDNVPADTIYAVKPGLALDSILIKGVDGEKITPNTQVYVNTNVFPVVYDMNDDGKIDVNDLILFIQNYGASSVNSLDPRVWALDFDNSGRVDIQDLISFVQNYGVSRQNGKAIQYPPGFMQWWIGTQLLTDGDPNLAKMLETVIRDWQDALGEQFSLEVQIIVKNLGENVLGESVVISTDAAGKPNRAVIYLDATALGMGWYVNESDSWLSESGRYDLYTVLAHELGHALGFNPQYEGFLETVNREGHYYVDSNGELHILSSDLQHLWIEGDLMYYQISTGQRKSISMLDVEIINAARQHGGGLTGTEALSLQSTSAAAGQAAIYPLAENQAVASTIVDAEQWTRTLETRVAEEVRRMTQLLSGAALQEAEKSPDGFAAVSESDVDLWDDLAAGSAAMISDGATRGSENDLTREAWESLLKESENENDEIDFTLWDK